MKTARHAAVLAAALAGAVLLSSPARAGNDYEYAKELIDYTPRLFDLAERFLKKLEAGNKAEAMLGMAYLQKVRGDAHKLSEPAKRRDLYEGRDGALHYIAAYEKAASKTHRLRNEAISLKSSIQQELARVYEDLIHHPDTPNEVKKALRGKQEEIRLKAVAGLRAAMDEAEAVYAKALKDWRDPGAGNKPDAERKKNGMYVKYVLASQKYIRALVKGAEGLEKGSDEQKRAGKTAVETVTAWNKHQSKKMYDDAPEGVQMWMSLHLARGYVFAGDVGNAVKEGFDKVLEVDPERFAKSAQSWAWRVRLTSMMFMALALFDEAEKSEAKDDYHKALRAIGFEFFVRPETSEKVLGIRAHILKGRILSKLKDYGQSIAELNRARGKVDKLRKRGEGDPQFKYAADLNHRTLRAFADVVLDVMKDGRSLDVSPDVLVEAGRICYQQEKFEAAVSCFQQAINGSRSRSFEQRVKNVKAEPTAWYYMGIAYYKLHNYLEAQLAYEGGLIHFWDRMSEKFKKDPKNKELIQQLKNRVLNNCARNGRIAAASERGINPSKFNNDQVVKWIEWEIKLDPDKAKDLPYHVAMNIMSEADGFADAYRKALRDRDMQKSRASRTAALEKYTEGRKRFLELPEASRLYEEGLYYAGVCSYQAMSLRSGRDQTAEDKEKAKALADEALKHFDTYEKWIGKNPPRITADSPDGRVQERQIIMSRRRSHSGAIALYRPFIYFDLKQYKKALEFAEPLRKRTDLDSHQMRSLHQILFKCYTELALQQKDFTELRKILAKGEGEADWFKAQASAARAADEKSSLMNRYYYYINTLASKNGEAMKLAVRASEGEKWGKSFHKRRGELISILMQNPDYQNIDGLGLVAQIFIELEDYEQAKQSYKTLLEKFDPDNDRKGKHDDKLIKIDDLKNRAALMNTVEINTDVDMDKARRMIDLIKRFVHGRKAEAGKREVQKDYDKAVRAIEAFLKAFPGYDMKKEGKKKRCRLGLEELKDELLFRLQLLRAANGKTICDVNRGEKLLREAEKLGAEGNKAEAEKLEAEAKKAFAEGLESAEDALKYWPKDADVRYNLAVCSLHVGEKDKLRRAKEEFDNLRAGSHYNGTIWWKATQGAVRARIEIGEYDEARTILGQILLTSRKEDVDKGWPGISDYVRQVAKKKSLSLKEFLGKKIDPKDLERFDYRPKSALERLVDNKLGMVLPMYISKGQITKETQKLRESLLKELLELAKEGKLKAAGDSPDDLVHKLSVGKYTSLKSLGGNSRGPEHDKLQPPLKGEKKEEKKEPKKPEKKTDAGRAAGGSPSLAVAVGGGL